VERDSGAKVIRDATVTLDLNRPARPRTRARFNILHEDDHVLVINKPAGVLSIPTSPELGNVEDTVLRRVREYVEQRRGHKGYVGLLHRLDRDTSGALALALSKEAHAAGRELFKHHQFERHYLALVQGVPDPPSGTIRGRISSGYRDGRRTLVGPDAAGLDATTDYLVRERFAGAALLELRLHTGRQHQIRLHLEQLGHPLVGERVYSPGDRGEPGARRNMLHAWTLAFPHPVTGARISVEAPLPRDFQSTLRRLGPSLQAVAPSSPYAFLARRGQPT
jgi:23S rRNA pseudouridine1911/1915/1917 synthase